MLPNVGMGELLIILVIVLLLFGAKRLPEVARGIGKSLKAFLRAKEKEYLKTVIDTMGGDKARAAKELDISLATLYRKLPEGEQQEQ